MANLCIIPARGGSKRIPRKNIKDFLGKPIIAYSIEAALKSNLFDEVMVSTDDTEIAEIAQKYGAKVPFMRSKENSNDFATTMNVLQEVMESYKMRGQLFENVCCIYPCAPFVTKDKLQSAYHKLLDESLDSVFPVIEFTTPVERSLNIRENKVTFKYPEYTNTRSQDIEQSYYDAGQFYWMNWQAVSKQNKILTSNSGAVIVSLIEAQDIDNEIDWKLAELKYQLKNIVS